ncbi:MAG: hypothetical protein ACPLRW_11610 [Moorellales bacterium]
MKARFVLAAVLAGCLALGLARGQAAEPARPLPDKAWYERAEERLRQGPPADPQVVTLVERLVYEKRSVPTLYDRLAAAQVREWGEDEVPPLATRSSLPVWAQYAILEEGEAK